MYCKELKDQYDKIYGQQQNNNYQFEQLSDWIIVDDYCATRIIKNGNPNNVNDRVAFIEKTPRVRIPKGKIIRNGNFINDNDVWLYGNKGTNGYDEDSRKWCNQMLKLLGYK